MSEDLIETAKEGLSAMIAEWDKLTQYGSPLAKAANENLRTARAALAALSKPHEPMNEELRRFLPKAYTPEQHELSNLRADLARMKAAMETETSDWAHLNRSISFFSYDGSGVREALIAKRDEVAAMKGTSP